MSLVFSFFTGRLKSQGLSQEGLLALSASAEILEQDAHGPKVMRLQNGDILKIFRVKRLISSARFYSYARRFCRNAERLRKLGIPSVAVKQLYHLANSDNTAVLYEPLQGRTLREISGKNGLDEILQARLGVFVATLHEKGVYFRSLHLGNIVLTLDNSLGLIDIADMRIFPWQLGCGRRLRNLRHMRRLKTDVAQLGKSGWDVMLNAYLSYQPKQTKCERHLKSMRG